MKPSEKVSWEQLQDVLETNEEKKSEPEPQASPSNENQTRLNTLKTTKTHGTSILSFFSP